MALPTLFNKQADHEIQDADYQDVDPHAGLPEDVKQALDQYIGVVSRWQEGDVKFVGNAIAVEDNLDQRIKLMEVIASSGALDHARLKPYKAYVVADRAALAQPDLAEEAYERFQERRDKLRDQLELETLRISASEYEDLAIKMQNVMLHEEHIGLHRDFIDIRKEIAQENAMHPRFVAEVATSNASLFDELLVDLDRGDLRDTNFNRDGTTSQPWIEDSQIRADLFSRAVQERDNIGDANGTNRVQKFGAMIAIGKQIIHDPLAIKAFAEGQKELVGAERKREIESREKGGVPLTETAAIRKARNSDFKQLGGKNYEIGMAALENKKFSPEMSLSFFESINYGGSLPDADRISIFGSETMADGVLRVGQESHKNIPSRKAIGKVAKDPVAMFRAANAAFRHQFDAGDAKAGLSYSVMEYTAKQFLNDPEAIRKLAEQDLDAAQAVEQFRPENKEKLDALYGGQNFEDEVFQSLQKKGSIVQESSFSFSGIQITEAGELDLDQALQPQSAEMLAFVGDDGAITLAASKKAYEAGDTISFGGPFINVGAPLPEDEPKDDNQDDPEDEKDEAARQQAELDKINHPSRHLIFAKGEPGEPVPVYVSFDAQGQVLLANSKADLESGAYAQLPNVDPTTQAHQDTAQPGSVSTGEDQHNPTTLESIKGMVGRDGPYIHVLEGGEVVVAATESDFEAGRGVQFSLYGIKAPPPGKDYATKDDAFDAGYESKKHLEGLIQRYGKRGMVLETVDGRDGQKEIRMRLSSGEDVSYRMIRDGYALPSECETMRNRREEAAHIADRGNKGLWAHGFPDDDGSWRSESLMPHLTRKDKRENLKRTVHRAMAGSPLGAQRIFSDKSAELFALDVGTKWEHPSFYREAWEAVQANPERMQKLYRNNIKLMKELRSRKDNMTEEEKVSHDQLNIGARLVGRALSNVGEKVDPKTGKKSWKYVSPMEVIKDTDTLLSKRGLAIPQSIKDTFGKGTEVAGQATKWGLENTNQFAKYVLGVGDQLT